jgi:hypothetical protein
MTSSPWLSVSSLSNTNLRILELETRRWSLATHRPNCTLGSRWVSHYPLASLSLLLTLVTTHKSGLLSKFLPRYVVPSRRLLSLSVTHLVLAASVHRMCCCVPLGSLDGTVSHLHFHSTDFFGYQAFHISSARDNNVSGAGSLPTAFSSACVQKTQSLS